MGQDIEQVEEFHGIKLLSGPNTHPGSGPAAAHEKEYQRFLEALGELNPEDSSPVMLELGAYWGLWSLVFRDRFPGGSNILVEYGSHQLAVGIRNFQLNEFNAEFIHGGVFLGSSGTSKRATDDIEFSKNGILGVRGSEVDIVSTLAKLERLDLIHSDIQGSELEFLEFFIKHDYHQSLRNQVLIICTHSAKDHILIKLILRSAGYRVIQEDPTYGRLGHFLFRTLRLSGKENRKKVFQSKIPMSILLFLECFFRINGQTEGVGQDGWLVFRSKY